MEVPVCPAVHEACLWLIVFSRLKAIIVLIVLETPLGAVSCHPWNRMVCVWEQDHRVWPLGAELSCPSGEEAFLVHLAWNRLLRWAAAILGVGQREAFLTVLYQRSF